MMNKAIKRGFVLAFLLYALTIGAGFVAKAQQTTKSPQELAQDLDSKLNSLDAIRPIVEAVKPAALAYAQGQSAAIQDLNGQVRWWSECAKDLGCWAWIQPPAKVGEVSRPSTPQGGVSPK
jgi:hypothetical protein